MSELEWQTYVYMGGTPFMCVESYDSIHQRISDSAWKADDEGLRFAEPLELTVAAGGKDGGSPIPVRACFAPQVIGAVMEIPSAHRTPVEVPAAPAG